MSGLEKDTMGGFNSIIKKQRKGKGEVLVTTVLFDDRYTLLHDRCDLCKIKPITGKEYFVEGSTALLDAMGKSINRIKKVEKNKPSGKKADNVLFVIITDGMENASTCYGSSKIKRMVEKQKEKGWEFLFLGANIDAVATAREYGISKEMATDYHADRLGTKVCYAAVSEAVSVLRSNKKISSAWKEEVEQDFEKRKEIAN
jgi:uncharacterized protein YegL